MRRACLGRIAPNSPRQAATRSRSTTRTVLRSSVRTLFTIVRWRPLSDPYVLCASCVKTKSAAVIGTPSLQRASGRMWYVSVNGAFVVNSTPETSCSRHLKLESTSNGASRTRLTIRSAVISDVPGMQSRLRELRHAGSVGVEATTTVPPRSGVCTPAPPAPETARSETAITAATASGRATSSPRSGQGRRKRAIDREQSIAARGPPPAASKSGMTGPGCAPSARPPCCRARRPPPRVGVRVEPAGGDRA